MFLKIESAAFVEINWEVTIQTRVSNWFFLFGLNAICPFVSITFF